MPVLRPHQLTVLTTSNCTARCGHCSMNSAPGRRDRLSFEDIRVAVDDLHALNPLVTVIFAGGEPTLLGEELLNAIAHVDALGINTRLVTNAYWATSAKHARDKLTALREAGLRELNISADDYHLPFIPFERVINAWHASKGLGFGAVIIANCSGPRSLVTPRYIMDRLGEDLPLRYDEDGVERGLLTTEGTYFGVSNANLQRLGRANKETTEVDYSYPSQEDLDLPCPWAVRSAALSPRNHLVACCGIEAEGNAILDFGDADQVRPAELVNRADQDLIVNAISILGPMRLKKFIEHHSSSVAFRQQYGGVCEVCEHVVTRPEALAVLHEHSFELATLIVEQRIQLERAEAERDTSNGGPAPGRPNGRYVLESQCG